MNHLPPAYNGVPPALYTMPPGEGIMSHYLLGSVVLATGLAFSLHGTESVRTSPHPGPVTSAQPGLDPDMPLFLVCARANDACATACELCSAHCARIMSEGPKKEHWATMRLCQDCAAICQAASRVTAKDGPMTVAICTACADACKRCGDACARHTDDPIMKRCTTECRNCERTCREMMKK